MDQISRFATWIGGNEQDTRRNEGPVADEEDVDEERVGELLQEFAILLEYERVQELLPPGMYVIPSFDSVYVWDGTVFVRQGLYRGAVFKFQLRLPENYPEQPPEVKFISDVFHPLVEPGTGKVDLDAVFPKWTPGRDYASFVLPHLHKALLRREYFAGSSRQPLNQEAHDLFLADPAAFAERAAKCASYSIDHVQDSAGKFTMSFKGPTEPQDEILGALRDIDPSYSIEDQQAMFVDWFLDKYSSEEVVAGAEVTSTATER